MKSSQKEKAPERGLQNAEGGIGEGSHTPSGGLFCGRLFGACAYQAQIASIRVSYVLARYVCQSLLTAPSRTVILRVKRTISASIAPLPLVRNRSSNLSFSSYSSSRPARTTTTTACSSGTESP